MNSEYHVTKLRKCEELGIRLLTVYEDEWDNNQHLVLETTLKELGMRDLSVESLTIKTMDDLEAAKFLNSKHIRSNDLLVGDVSFGLYLDTTPISMITLSNEGDGQWQLESIVEVYKVKGGLELLLSKFEREYNPSSIECYVDLRWDDRSALIIAGFQLVDQLAPDYYYKISNSRWSRVDECVNHTIAELPNYDNALSLEENMRNNGHYRIWDCGSELYAKVYYNNI